MKKGLRKIRRVMSDLKRHGTQRRQIARLQDDGRQLFELAAKTHGIEGKSKAQFKQDIFVLLQTGFKRNGYFVDFGATNGIDINNSYLLEKEFGWTGILAEPARIWHKALEENRTADVETSCVWKTTGETLLFNETDLAELSTINDFSQRDTHAKKRQNGTTYEVQTISLNDLLHRHGAPQQIDYLSIDTEGSELEILRGFDFESHKVKIITCEHNFTDAREQIFELLSSQGYERVFQEFSDVDDWYVLRD